MAAVRALLTETLGFDDADVVRLVDTDPATPPPTGANIKTALTQLVAHTGVGDALYVHFSGHGTQARGHGHATWGANWGKRGSRLGAGSPKWGPGKPCACVAAGGGCRWAAGAVLGMRAPGCAP